MMSNTENSDAASTLESEKVAELICDLATYTIDYSADEGTGVVCSAIYGTVRDSLEGHPAQRDVLGELLQHFGDLAVERLEWAINEVGEEWWEKQRITCFFARCQTDDSCIPEIEIIALPDSSTFTRLGGVPTREEALSIIDRDTECEDLIASLY